MNINYRYILVVLVCGALHLDTMADAAPTTAFTYQGRLQKNGGPAHGQFLLQFSVYESLNGPSAPLAGPITRPDIPVTNGLFTVTLDFGSEIFVGEPRWLEVEVRGEGESTNSILVPRQALTAAPYALMAGRVLEGGIPAGTYEHPVTFNNTNNVFTGSFRSKGSNVFSGPIYVGPTNDAPFHTDALIHIVQPDFNGPAALVLDGAYVGGSRYRRYRTRFGAGNPAMYSNGFITLNGGVNTPPFHQAYMLGIFTDVKACIELVNQFSGTNAFLIEASGPILGRRYPQVFAVSSKGQLSLVNPYGDDYPYPQLLLTDGTASTNRTYDFYSRDGLLTIGSYDTTARVETPVMAFRGGNVGIGTTEPAAALDVRGTIYAPTNIAPFSITSGSSTVITNSNNRSEIVLQIAFNLVVGGVPSCSLISSNHDSTNTFVASPLPAGLGLTTSVTNIYTLPLQPDGIITVTDTSGGTASIGLLDYTLFGQ